MSVLIVGGGLAGLSAATLLTRFGINCTTLSPEFGGDLSSVAVASPYGEGVFRFDFGARAYPKDGAFHQLVRGVEGIEEHDLSTYYLEMPYPDHSHWVPFAEAQETDQTVVYEPGTSLKKSIYMTHGKGLYNDFFEPFYERQFSYDPDTLDSDWLQTPIQTEGEAVYIPGHPVVQTMLASLMEHAQDRWTWVNGMAESFYRTHEGWHVLGRSGSSLLTLGPFDAVISTTGISEFVASLERVHGVNLPMTPWNNNIYCGVLLPEPYAGHQFSWFYPDVSLRAHRVSLQSSFHSSMAPEGYDSLMIEFPTQDELTQNLMESYALDVQTILELLGLSSNEVLWYGGKGYPTPQLGVRAEIAETKHQLMTHNLYSIGTWGSHVNLTADHILGEALRCANVIMSGEEKNAYLWSTDYYDVAGGFDAD